MICLNNVKKHYKNKLLYENVKFIIDNPGLYLLIGDSGVGKSTLLKIIAGFVSAKGKVVNNHKTSLSCLFQEQFFIEFLTVKENLELFNIDSDILKEFKLDEISDVYPKQLSTGQRQNLGFIISMFGNSQLVILDEPTNNLDKSAITKVKSTILSHKNNKIIIMVVHDYKEFMCEADGVIKIKDGKVKLIKSNCKKRKLIEPNKKRKIHKKIMQAERNFYKKTNRKMCLINSICLMLLMIISIGTYTLKNLVSEDISSCLEYNKTYLKECKDIYNKGFVVSKCSNPSKDTLTDLETRGIYYGLNYDYVLNHLYSREDLYVVSNSNVKLEEGNYPSNVNEVLADNVYDIGDKIKLSGNLIMKSKNVDIYTSELTVEVVGIYKKLNFMSENNIYFDYELVDKFYKNEMFKGSNLSVYEYYYNLSIDNYKFLSFVDVEVNDVEGDNLKYEFYSGIRDIVGKIEEVIKYISFFIMFVCIYIVYKLNKERLIEKQKGNVFLLINSFAKGKIVCMNSLYDCVFISVITLILSIFTFILTKDVFVIKEVFILASILIFILFAQSLKFVSRKNVDKLMRDEL